MRILMGSRAIRHHFPDFLREPKDWDYIGEEQSILKTDDGKVETYIIPALFNRYHPTATAIETLTPDELYTLKVSHLFWDINWEKHIFDATFLREHGAQLDRELFNELYDYWITIHGKPVRADLAQSKDEFFDNSIMKFGGLEHDDLHKIINPVPVYTKILIDPDGVEVSEEKYNQLSHEDKLELVREECYVMAFERLCGRNYREAFTWMVKQMVLTHAPMYEALFIIENFRELRLPVYNYKEKIENDISRNSTEN